MKPILLATDGSPSAEAATQEAIDLAQAFDAPLVVVSVVHLAVPSYGGYYGYPEVIADLHASEVERVGKLLAEVKDSALTAGLTCETVALDGPAASEICRVAEARNPRLIVIGAHGWGRIGRLLHGSVSTDVLTRAPCPVLVVHGDEPVPADDLVVAKTGTASLGIRSSRGDLRVDRGGRRVISDLTVAVRRGAVTGPAWSSSQPWPWHSLSARRPPGGGRRRKLAFARDQGPGRQSPS